MSEWIRLYTALFPRETAVSAYIKRKRLVRGHKFRIDATAKTSGTNSEEDPPEPKLLESYAEASAWQEKKSRKNAVSWVKELLVRSRGRELPGNFNPLLMSQLFREQSEHWYALAQAHIEKIHQLCVEFVAVAINEVVVQDVSQRLQQLKVDGALEQRYETAQEELLKLIEDKQRHPITYDPSYSANVKESRERKSNAKIQTLLDQAAINTTDGDGNNQTTVNRSALSNKLKEVVEPDMERRRMRRTRWTASWLTTRSDKVRYFITAVTEQVVERHLLHGLAAQTLSPMIIDEMDEGEVATIAAEEDGITLQREHLESQKVILESGQAAFRKAIGASR